MRDMFLVAAIVIGMGFTLRFPFVGILLWVWFSIMAPNMETYSYSQTLPLNFAIAVVTLISWLFSSEPKRFPIHRVTIVLIIFLIWMTFNSFFAFLPGYSWPYWDRTWKIFALGFMISCMATNKVRVEAVLWCAAISLMYYGVKGGLFTIAKGGIYKVYGPGSTIIGDNNQLALALLMILPLMAYLRSTVTSRLLSLVMLGSMVLIGISVLGSYSRGAYIAMGALALVSLAQSKRKFVYLAALACFALIALSLMPQSFYDRVNTIGSAGKDESFLERWMAWQVATRYAIDHFPVGAGFYAPQLRAIFNYYFPGVHPHAAHSIYFQVLGEHGFVGLAIYVVLLIVSMFGFIKLARRKFPDTDAAWVNRLSQYCLSSLIAFAIGGAALSMAYYDLFVIIICLIPPLTLISEGETKKWHVGQATLAKRDAQSDPRGGGKTLEQGYSKSA